MTVDRDGQASPEAPTRFAPGVESESCRVVVQYVRRQPMAGLAVGGYMIPAGGSSELKRSPAEGACPVRTLRHTIPTRVDRPANSA
jgi:hypothetical protein